MRTAIAAKPGWFEVLEFEEEGALLYEQVPVIAWVVGTVETEGRGWVEPITLDPTAHPNIYSLLDPQGRVHCFPDYVQYESIAAWLGDSKARRARLGGKW